MRDWRDMTRGDFEREAPAETLFTLEPAAVPVAGDLLELIPEEEVTT